MVRRQPMNAPIADPTNAPRGAHAQNVNPANRVLRKRVLRPL
jgi:hypothetical protein